MPVTVFGIGERFELDHVSRQKNNQIKNRLAILKMVRPGFLLELSEESHQGCVERERFETEIEGSTNKGHEENSSWLDLGKNEFIPYNFMIEIREFFLCDLSLLGYSTIPFVFPILVD